MNSPASLLTSMGSAFPFLPSSATRSLPFNTSGQLGAIPWWCASAPVCSLGELSRRVLVEAAEGVEPGPPAAGVLLPVFPPVTIIRVVTLLTTLLTLLTLTLPLVVVVVVVFIFVATVILASLPSLSLSLSLSLFLFSFSLSFLVGGRSRGSAAKTRFPLVIVPVLCWFVVLVRGLACSRSPC